MMWDWGISEAVMREITEIAKRNQIQEIILFGSRARGDYNRTSRHRSGSNRQAIYPALLSA